MHESPNETVEPLFGLPVCLSSMGDAFSTRIVVAKKDAPVAQTNRGVSHSITLKLRSDSMILPTDADMAVA